MIVRYPTLETPRPSRRLSALIEDLFGDMTYDREWVPNVDIKETEKLYSFICDLPGMNVENIEVEVDDNTLTIRGRRDLMKEEKREEFIRMERYHGAFMRSFALTNPVDKDSIRATYKDGTLMVEVHKVEAPHARKVKVDALK